MFRIFAIERVARLHILEFHGTANVASLELVNGYTVRSSTSVDRTDTLLGTTVGISQIVTRLDASAHHFEVAYFSDVRLHTGLEEVNGFGTGRIGSDFFASGVVDLRHFINEGHNIAKEFHQATYTHVFASTNTEYREYAACDKSLTNTFAHLVLGEALFLKELLHQGVVVGGSSFYKSGMKLLSLIHLFSRNILDNGCASFWFPTVFLHQ